MLDPRIDKTLEIVEPYLDGDYGQANIMSANKFNVENRGEMAG